jgi:hypothetical protein
MLFGGFKLEDNTRSIIISDIGILAMATFFLKWDHRFQMMEFNYTPEQMLQI